MTVVTKLIRSKDQCFKVHVALVPTTLHEITKSSGLEQHKQIICLHDSCHKEEELAPECF